MKERQGGRTDKGRTDKGRSERKGGRKKEDRLKGKGTKKGKGKGREEKVRQGEKRDSLRTLGAAGAEALLPILCWRKNCEMECARKKRLVLNAWRCGQMARQMVWSMRGIWFAFVGGVGGGGGGGGGEVEEEVEKDRLC